MKNDITVKAVASESFRAFQFSFEDLNTTESEWYRMDSDEQEKLIDAAIEDAPDQPYWVADKWKLNRL